ncbi:DNA repair protein RecN [Fructobacillus evanidus]|uniref:DNA repair protein RecN n=1 Tax=Fructobacillus evanidus TaxID=3064281 RepID=A0ABN9YRV3_9LACO|nr:DNA repair ATPase RecN (RecN) [Fructobacillus sp. LMG 32999]CAK1230492.1 DNA repair ATPase RecN (RecN) [Fructobacillus sp. LMG 32999]CAK1234164.1 DNA repair ATPase RecN (RecN) [Fructobacillus sp. LMG 32999]CAK1236411.1 DNA repair ATPase RecN (RecN) [Fructobacillus sp. LMG 32999]CAK1238166.1 DNA repair ATPase RecN (RecN) [Fructobacillus sp. LMG 32999]
MLEQLTIQNFAIIDQVDLSFDDQLTVLTGETGAGKSIIIDALAMVTGGRASTEMIRKGADKAVLQAVFSLVGDRAAGLREQLSAAGIELSDDQVVIYREFNHKGRSIVRINGVIVPLKVLSEFGSQLVEIQGQHDTSLLLNQDHHLDLLDQFAETDLSRAKDEYQGLFYRYRDITRQIDQLKNRRQDINQRLDLLSFQQEELKEANLQPGEEDQLLADRSKLANHKKIADALDQAQQALNPGLDGGAIDLLAAAHQAMTQAAAYDSDFENLAQSLSEAYYAAQDAGRDLDEAVSDLTFDEGALVEIDDRLQVIHNLKRKYGESVDEILAFQQKVDRELADLDGGSFDLESLTKEKETIKGKIVAAAQALTKSRQKVAKKLEKAVNRELADLLMEQAYFEVQFTPVTGFLPSGADKVAFFVQTNQGEGTKPLEKAASGGEASRLMLALKTIFIAQHGLPTVVFDEIDTGVSGRVGSAIAKKMRTIAEKTQVMAITHLPQVAAAATHHFLIEKFNQNDRTVTQVKDLPENQRDEAIAMMLSGNQVTDAALANAKDLRAKAQG